MPELTDANIRAFIATYDSPGHPGVVTAGEVAAYFGVSIQRATKVLQSMPLIRSGGRPLCYRVEAGPWAVSPSLNDHLAP